MSTTPSNRLILVLSIGFVAFVFAEWFLLADAWGRSVEHERNVAWGPNLLGDSFGVVNALLTAAAFVAVVATYRKERDALELLTKESNARKNDERKAILDRQLTSVIAMFRENREAFAREASVLHPLRILSVRVVIERSLGLYFLPLDTWCKLADRSDSPFDEYEKTVYAEVLESLLNDDERMVVTGQDIEAIAKDGTKHQFAVFIFKYKHKVDFATP